MWPSVTSSSTTFDQVLLPSAACSAITRTKARLNFDTGLTLETQAPVGFLPPHILRINAITRSSDVPTVMQGQNHESDSELSSCLHRNRRAAAPQRSTRERNRMEEMGPLPQRKTVGHSSRGLQRQWRCLELLHS